jgi:hypothetical protein
MTDLTPWDDTDYDLWSCLQHNPQADFRYTDITEVLARVDGERDECDWFWVLKLKSGQFAYLQGGCDYTGWDCQSHAVSVVADTPYTAIAEAPADHYYVENQRQLLAQITEGVLRSIRQQVGDALKDDPQPPGPPKRLIRRPRRVDF